MDLLESYGEPSDLYLSRSEEVNIFRPIFTGDVFQRREGECDLGMIIVLAHPCSIRGREAQLLDDILVCSVEPLPSPPPSNKWASGFYRKMPLPDLGVPLDELESIDVAVALGGVKRFFKSFDPDHGAEIDQCSYGRCDRDRSDQYAVTGVENARDMHDDAGCAAVVAALVMDDFDDAGTEAVEAVQRRRRPM